MSDKRFYDGFDGWADLVGRFSDSEYVNGQFVTKPMTSMAEPEAVFAVYDTGNYEGSALVLYRHEGKLFSVEGGHCSCYGLEGQWEPHEETEATIRHQAEKATYGEYETHRDRILAWLAA